MDKKLIENFDKVLSLDLLKNDTDDISSEIMKLVELRNKYKSEKNYLQADKIRDEILNLGCKAIEMETSALFSSCLVTEKECFALLAVSDNTILNKSLISGRTDEDMEKYHKTRYDIIPMIIFSLLENNNEI